MTITALKTPESSAEDVIERLAGSLADTMVETAKAQTCHWNVTGMAFGPLHALFQEMYEDHFKAQDLLAERIKALGGHADGRLSATLTVSEIRECDGKVDARQMVRELASDQSALSATFHELAMTADSNNDIVTHELAVERAGIHDKFAWILNAHLAD